MSSEAKIITAEAARFSQDQKDLIKSVLFKGASDLEIEFYWNVAERLGLDPFKRQIHAMKRWDSATEKDVMQFMVSIEGLRSIASRCKTHDGKDAYAGSTKPKFVFKGDDLDSAEVTVYRIVQGEPREFTAEVFYTECVQTKGVWAWNVQQQKKIKTGEEPNSMWKKRPRGQLGKCAEAAALRKAFPEQTGGVYIEDEVPDHDDDKPEKKAKHAGPKPQAEGMEGEGVREANATVLPPEGQQSEQPEARHWSDLMTEKAYNLVVFPKGSKWEGMQVWQIEKAGDFVTAFNEVPRAPADQQESVERLALDAKYFAKIQTRLAKKGYDQDETIAKLRDLQFLEADGDLMKIPGERLEDLGTVASDLPNLKD